MLLNKTSNVRFLVNKTNKLVVITPNKNFLIQLLFHIKKMKENLYVTSNNGIFLFNWMRGVMRGYKQTVMLIGIGYKAILNVNILVLTIGFSYKFYLPLPAEVKCTILKNIKLQFMSTNYKTLCMFIQKLQLLKYPNIYSGKGFQIKNKNIQLKKRKTKA